jgi:glycosyltransferase involved in cell wall biosynthesis
MMCGTPVIAFKRGSMKELIVDGKTGFLVDNIEEAVVAVKKTAGIKRSECRDHAMEKFSSDTMALSYMKLYEQVVTNASNF